jgi:hypothetical protein
MGECYFEWLNWQKDDDLILKLNQKTDLSISQIKWNNTTGETKDPFDFKATSDENETIFIDVKTTRHFNYNTIHLSTQEYEFAKKCYSIGKKYLVARIGNMHYTNVNQFKNLSDSKVTLTFYDIFNIDDKGIINLEIHKKNHQ